MVRMGPPQLGTEPRQEPGFRQDLILQIGRVALELHIELIVENHYPHCPPACSHLNAGRGNRQLSLDR